LEKTVYAIVADLFVARGAVSKTTYLEL